jgi:hypothetical protein
VRFRLVDSPQSSPPHTHRLLTTHYYPFASLSRPASRSVSRLVSRLVSRIVSRPISRPLVPRHPPLFSLFSLFSPTHPPTHTRTRTRAQSLVDDLDSVAACLRGEAAFGEMAATHAASANGVWDEAGMSAAPPGGERAPPFDGFGAGPFVSPGHTPGHTPSHSRYNSATSLQSWHGDGAAGDEWEGEDGSARSKGCVNGSTGQRVNGSTGANLGRGGEGGGGRSRAKSPLPRPASHCAPSPLTVSPPCPLLTRGRCLVVDTPPIRMHILTN